MTREQVQARLSEIQFRGILQSLKAELVADGRLTRQGCGVTLRLHTWDSQFPTRPWIANFPFTVPHNATDDELHALVFDRAKSALVEHELPEAILFKGHWLFNAHRNETRETGWQPDDAGNRRQDVPHLPENT